MVLTRIEIEREKLEMKLDGILQSQMKLLKTWRSMKRQYVAAITLLQECLYSVACRVHLLEGAQADEIAGLLSELAEVVVQEKFLLQEFNDMFHTMCLLQLEELYADIVDLKEMYREQVNLLVNKVFKKGSISNDG
ncbi:golgin candidate 5 isoform X3 [Vigna angularis]|uniref:golgin candidate 5 isoform X3 n=1 Tax=Phaseolus angularis TaxID=3914 RepID=UPI0022B592CF|nr:golgin candidate 5 isoform X3 [Vigna angularis]